MAEMPGVALGKRDYKYDRRTISLGEILTPMEPPPATFDYDKGKKAFPLDAWGNDKYGDCVFVSQANGLVRLERAEHRRTPNVTAETVVDKYSSLTGCKSPGDVYDSGYVILDALRDWRNNGWKIGKKDVKISAFGELNYNDGQELRTAIWLLSGVHLGLSLPSNLYYNNLVHEGATWDLPNPNDDRYENRPGSWGGHAVYSKKYDEGGIEILTWGMRVYCTNAFLARYLDEAWAVVDKIDGKNKTIDVPALEQILQKIADRVEE